MAEVTVLHQQRLLQWQEHIVASVKVLRLFGG